MQVDRLRQLLDRVSRGETGIDGALDELRDLPFDDLGFARVDHHRSLRRGVPEVIFAAGKTPDQLVAIARSLRAAGSTAFATRCTAEQVASLTAAFPDAHFNAIARTARIGEAPRQSRSIAIICAGTSDLPVAEEARETAVALGHEVRFFTDVGVAGLHRLLAILPELRAAAAIIAVAGMEGALPSVVAGLVAQPVIAVPTSVGYGASFGGLAALLAMLNSCAAGVTVVNIDNGFGAAYAAALIARTTLPPEDRK